MLGPGVPGAGPQLVKTWQLLPLFGVFCRGNLWNGSDAGQEDEGLDV